MAKKRHFGQVGKPQSLSSLSIAFFLFREIVGEVAKTGKLARSRLPSACVRACTGMRLGVLRGVGVGKKKTTAQHYRPPPTSPGDYLAIGDVDRQINVPEGARSDLPHQFVFPSDDKFGLRAAAARHPEKRRWRRGRSPDTSRGRMEASGSVPPGKTAERGRQAKSEALLALQGRGVGCEKPDRRRSLRAGSRFVKGGRGG